MQPLPDILINPLQRECELYFFSFTVTIQLLMRLL
ncbi:Uncharacterised protein [Klebsiella pneumoniae]|nr:Uncharacterised protein [Klebsiella pneumoniae]